MNQQETAAPPKPSKKQVRKEIVEKLTGALSDYKQDIGEKKLATHVKSISKLISRDLEKSGKKQKSAKKDAPKKKASKKASKKAVKK
jgi:hypothetical protein